MACQAMAWAAVPRSECNIPLTLTSGQTFRWRLVQGGVWVGSIGDVGVELQPEADGFWWRTYPDGGRWDVLARYLRLDVCLSHCARQWKGVNDRVDEALRAWRGLRVLRQPPAEVLVAFICSSCNNVPRITRLVNSLADRWGRPLGPVARNAAMRFPDLDTLAGLSDRDLRAAGWGYRARYVIESARRIQSLGPSWLDGLARMRYDAARAELQELPGIGKKVADCICLFGYGFDEAVPVDVHVGRFMLAVNGDGVARGRYDALAAQLRTWYRVRPGWVQQYIYMQMRQGEYGARRAGSLEDPECVSTTR